MEWISVEKELPEFYEDVLITDGEDYAVGNWREDAKAWDSGNFGWLERVSDDECPVRLGKVTHWMRFPYFEAKEE